MSKLIDNIFELSNEYQQMTDMISLTGPDSQEIEFRPLYYPRLLEIRRKLSCLSLDLAKEVAKSLVSYKNNEARRKVQFFIAKKNYIAQGNRIGAAEAEAEMEIGDLRKAEAVDEGSYLAGKLIVGQVNEVLKALNQDISIIKKEYESINQIK